LNGYLADVSGITKISNPRYPLGGNSPERRSDRLEARDSRRSTGTSAYAASAAASGDGGTRFTRKELRSSRSEPPPREPRPTGRVRGKLLGNAAQRDGRGRRPRVGVATGVSDSMSKCGISRSRVDVCQRLARARSRWCASRASCTLASAQWVSQCQAHPGLRLKIVWASTHHTSDRRAHTVEVASQLHVEP
jgi:hypothetical protein